MSGILVYVTFTYNAADPIFKLSNSVYFLTLKRWLPYLTYALICTILSIITFIFSFKSFTDTRPIIPTHPDNKTTNEELSKITFKEKLLKLKETFKRSTSEFFVKLKKTLGNLVLVAMILSTVTEGIILKGFLGFMTLFIQFQFGMEASTASILTGAIALLSIIFGTLLSAFIINKFDWKQKGTAIFTTSLFFITSFVFFILFNYCPERSFSEDGCAAGCNCDNKFNPICSNQNSLVYFQSPCRRFFLNLNRKFFFCFINNNVINNKLVEIRGVIIFRWGPNLSPCPYRFNI
jgi:hypothetical protein